MNNNIEQIKQSGLHDYELVSIDVNYIENCVRLNLKTPKGVQSEISINEFIFFNITHEEKWGKGKYISSSDIVYDEPQGISYIEIELNSGDQIKVKYKYR